MRKKENQIRSRIKKNFDDHHKAKELRPLQSGENVFIPDFNSEGTVSEQNGTRSYAIQTENGNYQRNRRQLQPLPQTEPESETQSERHALKVDKFLIHLSDIQICVELPKKGDVLD